MLLDLSNHAVIQLIQAGVLLFFVLIVMASFGARGHLPKTKHWEIVYDLLLVAVLFVYAVVLKIYFST